MVKIAVVGNQDGWEYKTVKRILDQLQVSQEDTLLSGGARGVDTFAQEYAREKGMSIIIHYPKPNLPSPERYFQRNRQIAEECDWMVAFDKKSGRAGTKNTIAFAKRFNKVVFHIKEDNQVL